MYLVADRMVGMVATGGMWCSSAIPAVAILGRFAVASTFAPDGESMGRGPTGTERGGMSWRSGFPPGRRLKPWMAAELT
jgi:hypothetical protein